MSAGNFDIEGYPQNICATCNDTLDDISKFIDKFKESSHILQNNLIIKLEQFDFSDANTNNQLNVELEPGDIKHDTDDDFIVNEHFDNIFIEEHLTEENYIKKESKVKKHSVRRTSGKKKCPKSTSKLASSILEVLNHQAYQNLCQKNRMLFQNVNI
ncbi:unnamed protein product [Leptidea sinapis]|uniref:ZAD domain-containing protein n=1 Tax=Leptidea sinapis TaxID=189913 RepID=A0A5E4Q498_9NEOP|nr:unnamed protein product [Leptidea sinapis]